MRLALRKAWKVEFRNSVPLSLCKYVGLRTPIKEANASSIDEDDLFLMGTTQAKRLKQSIHVKRKRLPSLYSDNDETSTRSICHRWSTPGQIILRLLYLRRTGL